MSNSKICVMHGEAETFVAPFPGYIKEPNCSCEVIPALAEKPPVAEEPRQTVYYVWTDALSASFIAASIERAKEVAEQEFIDYSGKPIEWTKSKNSDSWGGTYQPWAGRTDHILIDAREVL